jgi:polyisoprenoid-binding protein YceI
MKIITSSLFLALLMFMVPNAVAEHQRFNIDPATSEVSFSLSDPIHAVHGTFHVQTGSVDFNREASDMSGSVVVAAGSGNSGSESRDHKMTADILDAPKFATVSFAPHSYQGAIAPSGDSTVQVTGTFTLHGTPHELTVPMQIHIDGTTCTAKTQFVVPYVKWGLRDPSNFLLKVDKEVGIQLTLNGHLMSAN